jgi:hypothetical protein
MHLRLGTLSGFPDDFNCIFDHRDGQTRSSTALSTSEDMMCDSAFCNHRGNRVSLVVTNWQEAESSLIREEDDENGDPPGAAKVR